MNRRDFLKGLGAVGLGEVPAWGKPMRAAAQAVGQSGSGPNAPPVAEVNYAALLGQHDIVYLSPVEQGPEGLPIGNGDLVGMVWMPPQGLELVLNKSDLWDDRLSEPPLAENWAWDLKEEEQWTALVSAGRVRVRSALPLLEPIYLDDFQARLNLYEAGVEVESASAVGKLKANCFIAKQPGVLVIDYEERGQEAVSREIELERWGSRRLFHWYSQYDPKATGTGLEGTRAGSDNDYIWIEQRLRGIRFAVVSRWVGGGYRTRVDSRHRAVLKTEASQNLKGQLYVAVVTSEEARDPLAAARGKIAEAVGSGYEQLLGRHRRQWGEFWSKSYVQIPEEYLENLYYFTLYQLAASSQGSYPPPHCGGFWFWKHDARRWGHYYHWNVQQQYWPVHASNHAELALPYLDFRYRTMPEAEKYAWNVHKRNGVFYSDVTDRLGRGTIHHHVMNIFSAGPQISMDFWRHYLYTQDRKFLRSRAYPHMKATAQVYLEVVEKDAQGIYHIPRATAYENYILQKDTITDLATIRQAFSACIRASEILGVDEQLRERWHEVVSHLVDFTVLDNAQNEDGQKLPKVFSSGLPLEDSHAGPDPNFRWKKRRVVKKGERQFHIAFFCEIAPIFPSGVVGLGQRGTEWFEAAKGTVSSIGIGPTYLSLPMVAAARLGMKEEALRQLVELVKNWQRAPQGFLAEAIGSPGGDHDYSPNRWEMNNPRKLLDGRRTEERGFLPSRWFDMPDLEVGGILMTTINEMLLQSHDGVIRLFPARPDAWKNAAFGLRAVGAFLVKGECREGAIRPVLVESLAGDECRVENPWPEKKVNVWEVASRSAVRFDAVGTVIAFQTKAGKSYVVFPADEIQTLPQVIVPRQAKNMTTKEWLGRRLGLPRYF
ncbi:MAG: hypothetical protein L0338_22705 [Acidobacteria bacterium]|nr:hypothetical protein [Acidobacteriota bacterium]